MPKNIFNPAASRRLVPISDNLAAWLAPFARPSGPIWFHCHDHFPKRQGQTARAAGVKWKHNALRHSYISYRLAQVQDAAKVSLEAGNSPAVIFQHYRELVRPVEAQRWFSIIPEESRKLIQLPQVAA